MYVQCTKMALEVWSVLFVVLSAIVVGTLHYVLTLVTSTVKLYKHLHKKIKQGNKNDHLERWSVFLIMKKNRTRLKQYNTMLFPY